MPEKKVIEDQNVLNQEKYQALNQRSLELSAIIDTKGNYTFISSNAEKLIGYKEDELIGKSIFQFIHPEDANKVKSEFEKIATNEAIDCTPHRFKTKNNKWIWLNCAISNHIYDNKINGYIINSTDVTNLIEVQNQLKKNNERFDLLNKITDDIIYEGDLTTRIVEFNENFYNYFSHEYNNKNFNLNDWKKLVHPADYKEAKKNWDEFISNSNSNKWIGEYRVKKQDGKYLYIEDTVYIIRNEKNQPQKVIGVLKNNNTKINSKIKNKIESQLATFFKEEINLKNILESSLKFLIAYGDFLTAEIWILNNDANKIHLIQSLTKDKKTDSIYKKTNSINSFEKGDGLPGTVWQKQEPEIWNPEEIKEKFKRTELAISLEIKSILGIPLFYNNNFIGTLILSANEDLKNDELRTQPFLNLGNFLGAEIKRKEQEEMLYLMFQSSSDILAIVNTKGYFTKVNPAFCKLLNYSEKELMANPYTFFLHPDDLNATNKEYEETITGERNSNNFTNRYRSKNGDYKWISWSSSDIFGEEGQVFAYGRNITDIKELQQLFLETAKLAKVGSWEYTLKNNDEIFLSSIAKKIFEFEQNKNIKYKDFLNTFSDKNKEDVNLTFNNLIKFGDSFDKEFNIRTKNNKNKWIRCIGQSEQDKKGNCIKISGSIQDINAQKQNELELAKKNNYLSALTDIITELLQSNNWYESLNNVFKIAGNTINVDRVYYFEIHEHPETNTKSCSQKIEWTQEHIEPEIENPLWQNIPVASFSDFFNPLQKGEPFTAIVSQLPEGELKESLLIQNIKSVLILPITINNTLHGFIGFDDCSLERKWKYSEISFLHNVTSNLAAKIHRMKVQADLESTLKERNNIIESIGDAFFTLDKNWIVTYWNKESEKITGVKREELIGKNFWEFFPHLKGGVYDINYKKSVKTNKNVYFQDFFEYLDVWLDVSAYPSKEGLSVYYKDITATKKYEEELRASNERFEKSTLATNDAIWDWNLEENSIYRGNGFMKLFGYAVPNKIYDIDILNLIKSRVHPDEAEEVIDSLKKAIKNPKKTNWEKEYRYIKANGKYAFVVNRGIIIRNESGVATRIVGALQDITERREHEESLKILNKKLEIQTKDLINSNQELEQFAYIASHDLQEPLRMVTSFLTQLENKYQSKLDDKGRQYIHFAVDGANRMRNIILDILEYSKVGKNTNEEKELININIIVDEVCKINQKVIEETKAKIIFNDLPEIQSYRSPLMQIFHNLIGNAIKYQKPNNTPIINITYEKLDKKWQFKIEDNGIGIAEEYLDKIFVIFQRLHSKEEFSGTGMGLAIVKKLIENLGGKIWIESEVGKGSAFYFTLP
ncbi:MAG TPA: PAS domain S-box protein [Flavobacterium sp.]|uniref:PAS domain S-box protein n=1 Tax=Flavobacterium sp. TaxID=239 RepID=UPI002B4B7913|nr:PAS domain S-box protein [Flavobacterium sp.]HLO73732.1 PAS domain S-box protein [Flavobacterium sp.]